MKTETKKQAIELRKQGKSMREICKTLNISKGSASTWLRHIELTAEQKIALGYGKSTQKLSEYMVSYSEKCKVARLKNQEIGRQKFRELDKYFAFGCALFWAEGSKNKSISFCNTDVDMMISFVNFIKKYFDIKREDFVLTVNCYLNNGLSLEQIQEYWLNKLDLPSTSIRKATIKSLYYDGKGSNKHPYGVCTVRIYRVDICQQLYGAIKEAIGDNTEKYVDIGLSK